MFNISVAHTLLVFNSCINAILQEKHGHLLVPSIRSQMKCCVAKVVSAVDTDTFRLL